MHKKLSILICTLTERKALLKRLMDCLDPQLTSSVEVLTWEDNRQLTTGAKRNILLGGAEGDYISFIDDDDLVSNDYVPKILTAIEDRPDCCSLQGEITIKGKKRIFIHSLQYDKWFEKDGVYYRCPNHLNAIRRDIALDVGFPEKDVGEDQDFSMKVYPLLNTQTAIRGTIYYYFAS